MSEPAAEFSETDPYWEQITFEPGTAERVVATRHECGAPRMKALLVLRQGPTMIDVSLADRDSLVADRIGQVTVFCTECRFRSQVVSERPEQSFVAPPSRRPTKG